MPTMRAKLKRGVARNLGILLLGLLLGGLVVLTGYGARDDASTVATDAAVKAAAKAAAAEVRRESYRQDVDAWHSRLAGCTRGKQDRSASAKAFQLIAGALRAQARYLNLVLDAKSVEQDVKDAALVNQAKQDWAARTLRDDVVRSLRSRTGRNLDCRVEYPKPPAPSGVKPLP